MENVSINLARDLPASARSAVENLLGRSLRDDEEVSIMALDPHPAPSGEARRASAERLRGALDQRALKALASSRLNQAVLCGSQGGPRDPFRRSGWSARSVTG